MATRISAITKPSQNRASLVTCGRTQLTGSITAYEKPSKYFHENDHLSNGHSSNTGVDTDEVFQAKKIDADSRSADEMSLSKSGPDDLATKNIDAMKRSSCLSAMADDSPSEQSKKGQTLMASTKQRKSHFTLKSFTQNTLRILGFSKNYDVNQYSGNILIGYLHWTFRTSFRALFVVFIAKFMIIMVMLSGFLKFATILQPTCVHPNVDVDNFVDIFELSWTTFTTVGYGNIYPSLSHQAENGNCSFIAFLTSIEAFIGILFSGFCGAIIFGKILRIQSQAQVRFSESIVIRYGQSIKNDPEFSARFGYESNQMACPILEFRIVNRLYDKPGCEIVDGNLNCMVLKTEYVPGLNLKNSYHEDRNELDVDDFAFKLELEMPKHAFFKRLWTARHVLDGHSPILTSKARRLVRKNGGFWTKDLSTYKGIRDSIQFDEFVVNLSGTCNISASNVYAQMIYTEKSLQIGARFSNIVYKHEEAGNIMLEINDINKFTNQCNACSS